MEVLNESKKTHNSELVNKMFPRQRFEANTVYCQCSTCKEFFKYKDAKPVITHKLYNHVDNVEKRCPHCEGKIRVVSDNINSYFMRHFSQISCR